MEVHWTGYSILRGLTFVELRLLLTSASDRYQAASSALLHFVLAAEAESRGGESEEFAIVFAEMFDEGREHEPEPLFGNQITERLGIATTDTKQDQQWARLLSEYYNPAARAAGEVHVRKTIID